MPEPMAVTPSVAMRRAISAAEVAVRVALVIAVPLVLPKVFWGDPTHYLKVARMISLHRHPAGQWLPYRKVFWEYPPFTLPLLFAAQLFHRSLATYRVVVGLVMVASELGCLHLLRRTWPESWTRLTWVWNLTIVPIALLAWFRFDFFATLLATIGLVAVVKKARGGGSAIAAGFATKLWPMVLVAPLLLRRRWHDIVVAVVGSAVVVAAWVAWSPSGVHQFIAYRSNDGLEVESLFGGFDLFGHHSEIRVISGAWVLTNAGGSWAQPVLYALLAVVVAWCFWRARGTGADLVAFTGALTLAMMLFSWILSPQYVVWAAPFVAIMAAEGHRRVAWWYGSATVVTFVTLEFFQQWYAVHHAVTTGVLPASLIVLRNALLVGLMVEMIIAIRPTSAPDAAEP